jgi:hypothetical protein
MSGTSIAEHSGFMFLGDHVPVRIDFRIAQDTPAWLVLDR